MPLVITCAAALIGLAVGDVSRPSVASLAMAAVLGALGAALAWQRPLARTLALAACAAALGASRASTASFDEARSDGPATMLAATRKEADTRIHAFLPEPQASLAAGVLLGGTGRLDAAFRLELRRSGLAHLVAIDGFKQVVVAAAVSAVISRTVGASAALTASVVAVTAYTLVTGAHPSAVRAGLMVALASLAALTGRVADPLTSVLVAVVVMAGVEPRILLDVGLQLSLSATLGIILLWPQLRRRLRRLPRFAAEPAGLTLAVTLATLPVMLSTFREVSLVSPLAHVAAVPLLAPLLVSSALLALLAPLPLVGTCAAWLVWLLSSVLAAVVHYSGSLPGAALSIGRPGPWAALLLAASLVCWGVLGLPELRPARSAWRRYREQHHALIAPGACIGVLLAAAGLLLVLRPDGELHIERLTVGRGEAIFIRGPTGRTELIVSGRPDPVALTAQVADHLLVWEHKLDRVVIQDARAERAVSALLSSYSADDVERPTSGPTTSAARPGSAN